MGIAASSNIKPVKLLLSLVIGATIGADITIIGSPGNLIAKNTIEEFSNGQMSVSFFEYAKIGIPMLIVVAVFLAMFGPKLIAEREAGDSAEETPDYSAIPKWHGTLTIVVLILTVIGMVLTDYIDVLPPMHITSCCGAVVLVRAGVLSQKEAFASFEMLIVFMLAFMMSLGTALNDTGAGKMIADAVVNLTGQAHPLIIMASLWILTWALTQVMSNTAACTFLCPIGWTIAQSLGVDSRAVVIAVFVCRKQRSSLYTNGNPCKLHDHWTWKREIQRFH